KSQRLPALQSTTFSAAARRYSHLASYYDAAPARDFTKAARGAGRSRRTNPRWGGALASVRSAGFHLSANLHRVDSGRRAFGRARRRALALCELHAALGRAATKNSRRAGLSRVSAFCL